MEILIKLPDPASPVVMEALAELFSRIGPDATVTTDAEWTVDRAVKMLRDTNARTILFVEAAVAGEGWVDGKAFRAQWGDTALRGPSASITRAIKRGSEQGLWSADITPPFTPTTPDKSGWSKTGGYYLAEGLLPIFTDALTRLREKGADA